MTGGQAFAAETWRDGGTSTTLWLGAGIVLLVLGIAGFLVHPALGLGAIALLAAPVFVVAPKYALLFLVALLPFDLAPVGLGLAEALARRAAPAAMRAEALAPVARPERRAALRARLRLAAQLAPAVRIERGGTVRADDP